MGLDPVPLRWRRGPGFRYAVLPHPSGVNRLWNDPDNRAAAERFIAARGQEGQEMSQKLTLSGDGMSPEDWKKLLFWHAVRVTQAQTPQEVATATRAAAAVERLARAAGHDPKGPTDDADESPIDRERRLAEEGTDLRDDQLG